LTQVAKSTGREISLIGRSLWRTVEAAREAGYLGGAPPFLTDENAAYLPSERVLLVCTGCQGEPRGAMSRIAYGEHQEIALSENDTVIFSSRIIPGNERQIGRLCNALASDGIEVITERTAFVHVSGHPARAELRRLYSWLKPKAAIPVHGEALHLLAHAELARSLDVPTLIVANGQLVRLLPDGPEIVDHVPSGRLALDGGRVVPVDGDVIRQRKRMMHHGYLSLAIVLDERGSRVARPHLTARGIADLAAPEEILALEQQIADEVDRLNGRPVDEIEVAVRRVLNWRLRSGSGKRPLCDVQWLTAEHAGARAERRRAGRG
jgi:ribonuclease J